jgi:hypothetical protein
MDAIAGRRLTRMALGCGLAALLAGAWVTAAADVAVYKWLDPQGFVHYSDRPPPPEGKLLSVETTAFARSHVGTTERPSAPPAPAPAGAAKQPPAGTTGVSPQVKRAVAEDVANARVEQCKQARDKYQRYVQSRRLIREGPDKERVYLSDAEIETERLNAKREADEACEGVELP